MYCINRTNNIFGKTEEKDKYFNRNFENDITLKNTVKECLTEYTLQDKIEALKNIFIHNEKQIEKLSSHKDVIYNIKKKIGVKECLQGDKETPFQTLITELRNTVTNCYWNKEVGRTRYQIPNLPVGMNPLETTFGRKTESTISMAEILRTKIGENDFDQNILDMYKKSHNSYETAEQVKRNYKKPFDPNFNYGELRNIDINGGRLKRLLTWINSDPVTIVNAILAEFMERSHYRVGESRNLKNAELYQHMVHGKPCNREVHYLLNDYVLNDEVVLQQKYLEYINSLRQSLKKRIPSTVFVDMAEEMSFLDKGYTYILPENEVYSILKKYKILINKTLLIPLLDILLIRKGEQVDYKRLLNLLNCKYHFPELPKIQKFPLECQDYNTTYKTTIGKIEKINIASIQTAGISSDPFGDRTTAYSVIFPDIFTRHGLNHIEPSKLRSKEEIKSIFENVGIQFPDNNFNLLWEKGLKTYGTENLSVESFQTLVNQYDSMITRRD